MLLLLFPGCVLFGDDTTATEVPTCTIEAVLSADQSPIGELVMLTGGPYTDVSDTTVRIGGVPAADLTVDRSPGCATCDACQTANSCGCGEECVPCEAECADCLQTVGVTVPEVAIGAQPVVLINRYGATEPLSLEVTAGFGDDPDDTDDTDDTDAL